MRWVITRHKGAIEWLKNNGIVGDIYIDSLPDPEIVNEGDEIFGLVPLSFIPRLLEKHCKIFLIEVPHRKRKQELTAEEMKRKGAYLRQIIALKSRIIKMDK